MKEKLLSLLDQVKAEIKVYADTVAPEKRISSGKSDRWEAKDLLAHIVEWTRRMLSGLQGGEENFVQDAGEIDAENAAITEKYRSMDWDAVLGVFDQVFQDLKAQLENVNERVLLDSDPWPQRADRPYWRWILGSYYTHPILHLCYGYLERGDRATVLRLNEEMARNLLDLDPDPTWQGTTLYNLACGYAVMGSQDEALPLLKKALNLAPQLKEWSKQDTDLDSLHGLTEYEALYVEVT